MPILRAGTIEFVHIELVSTLITFYLGQVLLYKKIVLIKATILFFITRVGTVISNYLMCKK
jgi:hypothetical protein